MGSIARLTRQGGEKVGVFQTLLEVAIAIAIVAANAVSAINLISAMDAICCCSIAPILPLGIWGGFYTSPRCRLGAENSGNSYEPRNSSVRVSIFQILLWRVLFQPDYLQIGWRKAGNGVVVKINSKPHRLVESSA